MDVRPELDGPSPFLRLAVDVSRTFIDVPAEDIDDRIEQALRLVGEFGGADRVTVAQPSATPTAFRRTHQWVRHGFPRIEDEEPAASYPWASRLVLVDRRVLAIARLDDLPSEAAPDRESLHRLGVKSLATFPLIVEHTLLGAVSLITLDEERDWPAARLDQLRLVTEIIASALARKRSATALQQTLAFEQLISALSTTFIDLPPEAVDGHITVALGRVAEFLDLDRSQVAQVGIEDRQLLVTHQWIRDDNPEWRVPPVIPADVVPWVVTQVLAAKPVLISRVDELPPEARREREFAKRHGPRSTAILPLVVGGVVIGCVTFATLRHERVWPPDVVDRLGLVTEIIAGALARKLADLQIRASLAENERLRHRLEAENVYLQAEIKGTYDFEDIVGRSPALRAVLHQVDQVGPTDVPVLLLGETGTGKELIARAVHARSPRHARPLIAVNCAALPPSLVESELFGHEKGAFTGAVRAHTGRFELADGSTLFLDEIGDLDPALQAKLLRALQGGEIQRVGSAQVRKVDVRVVAATNRDLDEALKAGRFRADLYYRLGVFPIELPPLRDRREDIPLLVWHFIQSRQPALGRTITQIPRAAMDALVAYDWPGNVRELQNVIDRALILSSGPALRVAEAFGMAPARLQPHAPENVPDNLRDAERAHITALLERCAWTIEGRGQAADRLGLRPSTLRNLMRRLGIQRPPHRPDQPG